MEKKRFPSEIAYISALVIQAFGIALVSTADLGLSMVVAPSYLLSLKLKFLTFGQAEYVMQALIFVIMCLIVRKFKLKYLISVISLLIYGAILDALRYIIPFLNPNITPPGAASFSLPVRFVLFIFGMLTIQFSVALSFHGYLTQLVTDFFIEEVSESLKIRRAKFKTIFDMIFLALSVSMSFALFGKLQAVGVGTIIQAITNGFIIGFFDRSLDRIFEFPVLNKTLYNLVNR